MDENLIQAFARLQVHEFALEVMMANWVADMGEEDGDRFLSDFCSRSRSPYSNDESAGVTEAEQAMLRDAVAMTDNLARKVSTRAAQIREARLRLRG